MQFLRIRSFARIYSIRSCAFEMNYQRDVRVNRSCIRKHICMCFLGEEIFLATRKNRLLTVLRHDLEAKQEHSFFFRVRKKKNEFIQEFKWHFCKH